MTSESLTLDGNSLTIEKFVEVVKARRRVSLSSHAKAVIQKSRSHIDRAIQS